MSLRKAKIQSYVVRPLSLVPTLSPEKCPTCIKLLEQLNGAWRQQINALGQEVETLRQKLEDGVDKLDGVDVSLGTLTNGKQLTYNSSTETLELDTA